MRRVGQLPSNNDDYPRREECLTGVMPEFSVSERSDLDMGEARDGRSDTPIDVAMVMATAVIPIATETAGTTIWQLVETNKNRTQRRNSEAMATALAHGDWRSCME